MIFFIILASFFLHENAQASFPKKLSEWPVFNMDSSQLGLKENTFSYHLVNPLFSDYARKFRTVTLPKGGKIKYREFETFDFPDGTIITKTFAYPKARIKFDPYSPLDFKGEANIMQNWFLIETRILFKKNNRWLGLPYQWDEDQKDATLKLTGAKKILRLNVRNKWQSLQYKIPNFNQCRGCHLVMDGFKKDVLPIGPKAHHLNRKINDFSSGGTQINQLYLWKKNGLITDLPDIDTIPKIFPIADHSKDLRNRAKAYLDVNCAHCHNPNGPASSSGLYLDFYNQDSKSLGLCKSPVAIGNGGGNHLYDIQPGHPEFSLMIERMNSNEPSIRMPELGRNIVHLEGVELIYHWIKGMEPSDCL